MPIHVVQLWIVIFLEGGRRIKAVQEGGGGHGQRRKPNGSLEMSKWPSGGESEGGGASSGRGLCWISCSVRFIGWIDVK